MKRRKDHTVDRVVEDARRIERDALRRTLIRNALHPNLTWPPPPPNVHVAVVRRKRDLYSPTLTRWDIFVHGQKVQLEGDGLYEGEALVLAGEVIRGEI